MAGDKVLTLGKDNWEESVLQSGKPVLVDFWAAWCGPCRTIAPIIDELAVEYDGQLAVGKLNVDDNRDIASQYAVMSIPTLIVFKNGQPVERLVGAAPKRELKKKIDSVL